MRICLWRRWNQFCRRMAPSRVRRLDDSALTGNSRWCVRSAPAALGDALKRAPTTFLGLRAGFSIWLVDNSVILRVGSPCDGARRIPLLARAGTYPWAGFAAFCSAAEGV